MQEKRIQAFALAKGWNLVKIFGDDGLSAKNLKGQATHKSVVIFFYQESYLMLLNR